MSSQYSNLRCQARYTHFSLLQPLPHSPTIGLFTCISASPAPECMQNPVQSAGCTRIGRRVSISMSMNFSFTERFSSFYLNLVDWSSTNVLGVGLGSCVYLWEARNAQVAKLCDLGVGPSGMGNSSSTGTTPTPTNANGVHVPGNGSGTGQVGGGDTVSSVEWVQKVCSRHPCFFFLNEIH